MNFLLLFIKSHWLFIIFYSLYLLLLTGDIRSEIRFEAALNHINHGDRIAWSEGIMYGNLFTIIFGVIAAICMLGSAFIIKEKRKFYFIGIALYMIPLIILVAWYI